MKSSSMRKLRIGLLLLLASGLAQATNVTFQFSGTISSLYSDAPLPSSLSSLSDNTPFSGSYTFNSEASGEADMFGSISNALFYRYAISGFQINIGGALFSLQQYANGSLELADNSRYYSNYTRQDFYKLNTGGNLIDGAGKHIGIQFYMMDWGQYLGSFSNPYDESKVVLPDGLDSNSLSATPPDPDLFSVSAIEIYSSENGKLAARGSLETITLPQSAIPEPSTLLLVLLALVGVGQINVRRRWSGLAF